MANTLNLGNGNWATKKDSLLAYNNENNNFKPLPFDFTRASNATVVNKAGLIETVGGGEPRIDFSNDAKGALLLEPQRMNLFTNSENFSQWYIDGNQSSPTIISELNPDGSSQVYQINLNSGGNIYRTISISSSIDYTFSVYIKGTGNGRLILSNPQSTPENYVDFTATSEWQRIELTGSSSSTSVRVAIGSWSNSSASGTIQIFGAQLEQGSYATSYIPTQGSAVTRVADACVGAGNEQVINSTEGVLYAEISAFIKKQNSFTAISLSDNSYDNNIRMGFNTSTNTVYANFRKGSISLYGLTYAISNITELTKIAVKFNSIGFYLYINGVLAGSNLTSTTFPINTLTSLKFTRGDAAHSFEGKTKALAVYKTALTDAELIALTSL